MVRRRQLGIAVTVAAAGLAVLLMAGRAPVLDAGHDRPRLPVPAPVGRTDTHPLTPTAYAAWAGAQDRFGIASRALSKALGACRMRLGSFHACALPAVSEMRYEWNDLTQMTRTFERRGGPCGRVLHVFDRRLGSYMAVASAFADLPRGHPMTALARLQRTLLTQQEAYTLAGLRVRGECRPG